MKKMIIGLTLLMLTFSIHSCTNDSDSSKPYVSFRIDGSQKNFKATATESSGVIYINGYIGDVSTPTETVSFSIRPYDANSNDVQGFFYESTEGQYYCTSSSFPTSSVTADSEAKTASGTFLGLITKVGAGTQYTLSDGAFNIYYY